MKLINKYNEIGLQSDNEVFDFLINNLKDTISTYDFFVAWDKVFSNVSKVEVALNILNSLIGKDDINSKLKELIKSYPEIVPVIPLLIAVRGHKIKIADLGGDKIYSFSKSEEYSTVDIDNILLFAEKCGLLKILSDKSIKNLVDYCIGVEVGLDTNARKNRSGTAMENLTEVYLKAICNKHDYRYIKYATTAKIKSEFGRDVPTDKSDRHFDFAVNTSEKIYLIEVNYYGGGGSKLKAVAGEFKSLFKLTTSEPNTGFIWVTDGLGWLTAKHPLLETFNDIDYVVNLKMIENGIIEEILTKGL
jgi:type II restriction enzyme